MSIRLAAMSLRADRAEALNRCPVGQLRLTLSESDRTELDDLLRMSNLDMPSGIILRALAEAGHEVTFPDSAIQAHRRALRGGQGCKCRA